jgi:chromosome partitioning protein
MKVITFLNEKGGVGKTTVAGMVAAGLAIRGQRVLMLDTDPQGHLTLSFGIKKQHSLYDLLVRDADFSDPGIVHRVPEANYAPPDDPNQGALFIVPGNRETRLVAQAMDSEPFAFRNRLMELADDGTIDVVVIDTSPTPSSFHAMIYLATHHIVYPTEVAYLSFDGLVQSIQSTTGYRETKHKRGLEDLTLAGIVPTKYRANTLEHSEKLEALKARYGELVWPPLPLTILWEEAMSRKVSIFRYAYDQPVARAAWRIVDLVEAKVLS